MREPLTAEDHETIWTMFESGEIWDSVGEAVGRSSSTVRRIVSRSGVTQVTPTTHQALTQCSTSLIGEPLTGVTESGLAPLPSLEEVRLSVLAPMIR